MKAWVLRKRCTTGPLDEDAVRCEMQWPVVAPGIGQLRVKVICAALNPVDAKKISASTTVAWSALEVPSVLGCDGSGVVESLGAEDPDAPFSVSPGDRVYFHNNIFKASQGTFAEYTICDARAVCRIADNVSFADAAAVPCAGWTAFVALFDKLKLRPASKLLILGGSGGVGSFAISLAKMCGCTVAATCSASSASYVKELGADIVLDRSAPTGVLRDHLNSANFIADAVFDTVGALNDSATMSLAAGNVRFGGGICCALPVSCDGDRQLFTKALSIHYVFLGGHHRTVETQSVLQAVGDSVMQLMSVGVADPYASTPGAATRRLPSHLAELVQFSQVRQGLVTLAEHGARGKIVMSFAVPAAARRAPAAF